MSGQRFLTELATILRQAGCSVVEDPGWEFRSRSSGGYASGRPTHVMWHHTASGKSSDGAPDVNYICRGSPDRPLANLYLQRDGTVTVCAGGATNTNGKGSDSWGGGVPNDSMNLYAIGVEIGNDGVGERYTDAQLDAISRMAVALTNTYGIPPTRHRGHSEWAPGRKIDPAGPPSPWMNPSDSSRRWIMDQFRASLTQWLEIPNPQPDPGDDDMGKLIFAFREYANTFNEHGVHLSPEAAQAMLDQGATLVISELTWPMNYHLDSLLAMSGLNTDYLVPT